MKLYHALLGLPAVNFPKGKYNLAPSRHAREAANNDRYGIIDLPQVLDTAKCQIIEAATEESKLVKVVYRKEYDRDTDICLVVNPITWIIITVWLNKKNDNHRTLDTRKYEKVYA